MADSDSIKNIRRLMEAAGPVPEYIERPSAEPYNWFPRPKPRPNGPMWTPEMEESAQGIDALMENPWGLAPKSHVDDAPRLTPPAPPVDSEPMLPPQPKPRPPRMGFA